MFQAGVANRAPIRTAEQNRPEYVAAPEITPDATVREAASPRCSPPACEPMTASQKVMFQGLVSASVSPSR